MQITDMFNRRKKAIGLAGYTIREMMGQGGSANVYRITGRAGSPDYVIRISEEQKSSYSNDVYNLRELNILQELKRISQPHVVQYIDAFVVDIPGCPRYYCAVMKLLVPLNKYRLAGDGVEIAVRLGSDLLPLLQSFADKEILHRDIKPENIFYDGSFRNPTGFLLGDFGIAKRDSDTNVTPTGTESTIAPEVRGLDRSLTNDRRRCDMYSLGIVMYRYLNEGVYPSNRERIDKMPPDTNPFPEPRFGSKRLKQLVIKATSYDPNDRFDSPQAMLRELQLCDEYGVYIEQRSVGSQPTLVPPSNAPIPVGFPNGMNPNGMNPNGMNMQPQNLPVSGGFQNPTNNPQNVSVPGGYPGVISNPVSYSQNHSVSVNANKNVFAGKNTVASLLKNKVFLISSLSVAAVLLLLVILVVFNVNDMVEIAGTKYRKSSDTYLMFSNRTISKQDVTNITKMKALVSVRFDGCQFETGAFSEMTGVVSDLETLTIKGCTGIDDFSPVSSVSSLESLTISNSLLTDKRLSMISFKKLNLLKSIDLSDNAGLSDISCIKEASDTLRYINFSGTAIIDFSVLNGGAAEELSAENCGLTDSSLSTLPDTSLKKLCLSHNNIASVSILKKYPDLTDLDLSYNKIISVSPLAGCVKLKNLSLAHNWISIIKNLNACAELREVNVSYNNLSELEGLEQSIYLDTIAAAHNELKTIDGLSNCTLLQYVDLRHNKLSDISILSKSAEKLHTVLLDNNKLKDINALNNTVNLTYISIDSNGIKTLSPLKQSAALKGISASGNAIASLDPICNAKDLNYVYLSHNIINSVPDTFCYLENLIEVDLSFNYIKTGMILERSFSEFNLIALHGNPIDALWGVNSKKGTRLIVTYNEKMDFSVLKGGYYYYDIVDCPLDKQVEINEKLGGSVSFITPEEATKKVSKNNRLCPAE